jgi:hypothetical protein
MSIKKTNNVIILIDGFFANEKQYSLDELGMPIFNFDIKQGKNIKIIDVSSGRSLSIIAFATKANTKLNVSHLVT